MSRRPTMLILSFSPIVSDARVLKQVARFTTRLRRDDLRLRPRACGRRRARRGSPTTSGYNDLDGTLITAEALPQRPTGGCRRSRGHASTLSAAAFDVVLANDVEAVPSRSV